MSGYVAVDNFGGLVSKLTPSAVIEIANKFVSNPALPDAITKVATDAVFSGVLFAVVFYHFSMKWFESKFSDRSLYENYKKFWKNLMAGYNAVLSIYSAVTCVIAYRALSSSVMYSEDCGAIWRTDFEWAARVFYWSKFVEFADTYFLVIAGKPVSWLQYFHHAGACVDMWILFNYKNEGIWLFVQFNSFIHTIMYAYFTFTALGISVPGKQIVTLLQIVQLVSGNSFSIPYIGLKCYSSDMYRMIGWCVNFVYITILVMLFLHFAITTYILPSKKPRGAKPPGGKTMPVTANGNGSHKDE